MRQNKQLASDISIEFYLVEFSGNANTAGSEKYPSTPGLNSATCTTALVLSRRRYAETIPGRLQDSRNEYRLSLFGVNTQQDQILLTTKPNISHPNDLFTGRAVNKPVNRKHFRSVVSYR